MSESVLFLFFLPLTRQFLYALPHRRPLLFITIKLLEQPFSPRDPLQLLDLGALTYRPSNAVAARTFSLPSSSFLSYCRSRWRMATPNSQFPSSSFFPLIVVCIRLRSFNICRGCRDSNGSRSTRANGCWRRHRRRGFSRAQAAPMTTFIKNLFSGSRSKHSRFIGG